MIRTCLITGMLVVSLVAAAAQRADISNARVETGNASIAQVMASARGTADDPVWIGWRVPMAPGLRDLCSTWSDGLTTVRGAFFEGSSGAPTPPATNVATRVVELESGAGLSIWIRVIDGRVERLRALQDDCPVDGGGRRLIQLPSVTPGQSVQFLESLLAPSSPSSDQNRRLATSALMTIALHADASVDALLGRYLTADADDHLRRTSASWTARARGARGFDRLAGLLSSPDTSLRQVAASAIAETREPDTLATLWRLAERDADEQVRATGLAGYAMMAPDADVPRIASRLTAESSDVVKRHAVRSLARRPAETSVSLLVTLARTSPDKTVRLEATRALSRSNHPAAIAYLAEVLR